MLESRDLPLWGQPPPAPRTRDANNPTLLFSWWATIFAGVIIITRLCGRKVRSNMLFTEDWIMLAALVPLLVRMGLIHVMLLYGTNNVNTVGVEYTETDLYHRSIGSRLVLGARIFYAMFIWMSKLTVSEFLKRITIRIWRRSYELTLRGIRVFLVITFVVVVIATLTDCQPFDHYWQVVPDPGPHCRQGYSNLITMGTCDMITDILLVAFPIPIIMQSGQNWKRKFQLGSLFSLSIILIVITGLRVPKVIGHRGRQQYRTVWASCEILASASVSNAVILGSFLRDKGTKRNKYRSSSVSDSIDRASVRRKTTSALQNTGSDEDLFRFLGIRVPTHLQDSDEETPRPAPTAAPATSKRRSSTPQALDPKPEQPSENNSSDSDDSLHKQHVPEPRSPSPNPSSKRGASFFDIGGLLEDGTDSPAMRSRVSTLVGAGHDGTVAQDFASPTPSQSRRSSRAFLQDAGGLLTPTVSKSSSGMDRYTGRRQSDSHINPPSRHIRLSPSGILGPMLERRETQQSLQDPGGLLLTEIPESRSMAFRRARSDAHEMLPLRTAPQKSSSSAEEPSLQDLGGILSESHEPDASAAALERATAWRSQSQQQPRRSSRQFTPQNLPPPTLTPPGWNEMNFNDAGGLLAK